MWPQALPTANCSVRYVCCCGTESERCNVDRTGSARRRRTVAGDCGRCCFWSRSLAACERSGTARPQRLGFLDWPAISGL